MTTAAAALLQAGVDSAHAVPSAPSGPFVHYSVVSGYQATGGPNQVVEWVEGFVADPKRVDNLVKLDPAVTGAREAHLAQMPSMTQSATRGTRTVALCRSRRSPLEPGRR